MIWGQSSEKIPKTSFQTVRLFLETSFSRSAMFDVNFLTFKLDSYRLGVGSVVVGSAFVGRPDFQPRGPNTLYLRVLDRFGAEIWGAPNGDPHFRPFNNPPSSQHPRATPPRTSSGWGSRLETGPGPWPLRTVRGLGVGIPRAGTICSC